MLVGLPYPNLYSADIKVRMKYFDAEANKGQGSRFNGQEYYNSLCMKVVNQSVGRSVRHKDDYSAIVLVDKRFKNPNIIGAMPTWITNNKQLPESVLSLKGQLRDFFSKMKTKYSSSSARIN